MIMNREETFPSVADVTTEVPVWASGGDVVTAPERVVRPVESEETATEPPWNVVIFNDPVNLMQYVTHVLMKVFGYSEKKAKILMMQVHQQSRSIVWTGEREKAEFYVQQLQAHQLKTSMEKTR
jgi:ATP-dependent Clp protease adaptor protein ClpS